MSFFSNLRLGLWNAWILFLFSLSLPFLFSLVSKRLNNPPFNLQEKKVLTVLQITSFFSLIYSFFLPFKGNLSWLMIGLVIYMLGMILIIISGLTFEATTVDKPVIEGIYRYSRNPLSLGRFLSFAGIGIAYTSLLFLILSIVFLDLQQILVDAEERWCIKEYGDSYREYMTRTPKWIGIPKSNKKKKASKKGD